MCQPEQVGPLQWGLKTGQMAVGGAHVPTHPTPAMAWGGNPGRVPQNWVSSCPREADWPNLLEFTGGLLRDLTPGLPTSLKASKS